MLEARSQEGRFAGIGNDYLNGCRTMEYDGSEPNNGPGKWSRQNNRTAYIPQNAGYDDLLWLFIDNVHNPGLLQTA
jgi:hypothetical protein